MFINTLSILFAFTGLITPLEFGVILLAIAMFIFRITPTFNDAVVHYAYHTFYEYLHTAWLGHCSLKWVFWPFFILINLIFYYIDYRAISMTYTISSWKTVHSMVFLPIVWWTVAVWRCSPHNGNPYWRTAARTVTVYLYIELLLRLIIGVKYPQLLFDCKQLVIELGDC